MKRIILAIAAIAALGFAQPAAAVIVCQGTLSHSWMESDGDVYIRGSWRGDHTQMCNLKTEWKGITPDICAGWMAKADAAVSLGRTVLVYYPNETSCTTMPTYSATSAPEYVALL